MGSSPSYLDPFIIPSIKGPRILDVGCGFGRWGYLCTTNYWETAAYEGEGKRPEIIGCDGYGPNVEMSKRSGVYADVLNIRFPPLGFANLSFDTVLLVEVLEHLKAAEAVKLINEAKRIAKHRVIVSTPNRPNFRDPHPTITGWNIYEMHQSYLGRSFLKSQGFKVVSVGWNAEGRIHAKFQKWFGNFRWFEERVKPNLHGLGLLIPFCGASLVGIWDRGDHGSK